MKGPIEAIEELRQSRKLIDAACSEIVVRGSGHINGEDLVGWICYALETIEADVGDWFLDKLRDAIETRIEKEEW